MLNQLATLNEALPLLNLQLCPNPFCSRVELYSVLSIPVSHTNLGIPRQPPAQDLPQLCPPLWDQVFEKHLGGKCAKMLCETGQLYVLVNSCPSTECFPVPAGGGRHGKGRRSIVLQLLGRRGARSV